MVAVCSLGVVMLAYIQHGFELTGGRLKSERSSYWRGVISQLAVFSMFLSKDLGVYQILMPYKSYQDSNDIEVIFEGSQIFETH